MKENGPIHASDVRFLPIISAYARRLGLVEEVDRLCGPKRGVSDGQIVLARYLMLCREGALCFVFPRRL
ncbi:MAG: hypothetical protein WBG50_13815 [Desulfomonilaceae bacterium]